MLKLVLIEKSDKIDQFFSSFKEKLQDLGCDFEKMNPEDSVSETILSNDITDFFILDILSFNDYEEKFESLMSQISKSENIYFAVNLTQISQPSILLNLFERFPFVKGFFDLDLDINFYPFAKNLLMKFFVDTKEDDLKGELSLISSELSSLASGMKKELKIVKQLHQKLVPKKQQTIKGVQFTSRYNAGTKSGGEFFDMIESRNKLFFILASSSSYVASSILISSFPSLEGKEVNIDSIKEFINDVDGQLLEAGLDNDSDGPCQCFIGILDLSNLKWEGFNFGQSRLITSDDMKVEANNYYLSSKNIEQCYFSFSMERDGKYYLASPGVVKNPNGDLAIKELKKTETKNSSDVVNDVFFQLHKKSDGDFLEFDASLITIEVDPNVLVQA